MCPTPCMIALEPYMREFCIHFKGDIRECTTQDTVSQKNFQVQVKYFPYSSGYMKIF